MATAIDNSSLLLYRVGPVLCCAPSLAVESIIQPPSLTRPPGTDEANPGIFMYSGHVVKSFDLRYKFGVDEEHRSKPGRTVVVEVEPSPVGFWVDEIIDVITFPSSGWGSVPAHLPKGIFSRTLILNDKIYLYAEFQQTLNIPTSGYLRVYIEQLLLEEEKKKASAKSTSDNLAGRSKIMNSSTSSARTDTAAISPQKSSSDKIKTQQENDPSRKNNADHDGQGKIKSKFDSNNETQTPLTTLPNTEEQNAPSAPATSGVASKLTSTKSKDGEPALNISSTRQTNPSSEKITTNSSQPQSNIPHKSQQAELKASSVTPSNRHPASTTTSMSHSSAITSEQHSVIHKQESHPQQKSVTKQTVHAAGDNTIPLSSNKSTSPSQKSKASSDSALGQTQNKTEYTSPLYDDDSSSVLPMIFLLLLFVGSFAGLFWFLSDDSDTPIRTARVNEKPDTPKPVADRQGQTDEEIVTTQEKSTPETVAQIPPETDTADITSDPVVENIKATEAGTTVMDTRETQIPETQTPDTQPSETKTPAADTDLVEPESNSSEDKGEPESPTFRADIQKDDEGITIILEAPANENVFKPAEPDKEATPDDPPSVDSASTDMASAEMTSKNTSTKNKTMDTPQAKETMASDSPDSVTLEVVTGDLATQDKTQSMQEMSNARPTLRVIDTEIIHIVVKGDTLWHIAIKYVNDPYKYPELAKLSNIKNPDLIYPGNRVRIIKRSRQPQ